MTFDELPINEMFCFTNDEQRTVCRRMRDKEYIVDGTGFVFSLRGDETPSVVVSPPFQYYDTPPHRRDAGTTEKEREQARVVSHWLLQRVAGEYRDEVLELGLDWVDEDWSPDLPSSTKQ